MPTKQADIKKVTDQLSDMNYDELKQVRNYADNRIKEIHPDGGSTDQDISAQLGEMSDDDLAKLRENINTRLQDMADVRQGSADVSADDEKKKYIAQHGANPIKQERAQDIPVPTDDEGKKEQDEAALAEHIAKGPAADGSH